jgi:hypothetical protein
MKTEFYLDINYYDHYDVLTFNVPSMDMYSTKPHPFFNLDIPTLMNSRKKDRATAENMYGIVFIDTMYDEVGRAAARVYFKDQYSMTQFQLQYL